MSHVTATFASSSSDELEALFCRDFDEGEPDKDLIAASSPKHDDDAAVSWPKHDDAASWLRHDDDAAFDKERKVHLASREIQWKPLRRETGMISNPSCCDEDEKELDALFDETHLIEDEESREFDIRERGTSSDSTEFITVNRRTILSRFSHILRPDEDREGHDAVDGDTDVDDDGDQEEEEVDYGALETDNRDQEKDDDGNLEDDDGNLDDDDELLVDDDGDAEMDKFEDAEMVPEMNAEEISEARQASLARFVSSLASICQRYDRPFEDGDEIDILSMQVVVDRGYVRHASQPSVFGRGVDEHLATMIENRRVIVPRRSNSQRCRRCQSPLDSHDTLYCVSCKEELRDRTSLLSSSPPLTSTSMMWSCSSPIRSPSSPPTDFTHYRHQQQPLSSPSQLVECDGDTVCKKPFCFTCGGVYY